SLTFEASYYVGIALFVFARGWVRLSGLVLLAALAGPTMLLLAPTWLLGYAAYHIVRHRRLPIAASLLLCAAFAVLLLACPLIRENLRYPLPFMRMPD